MFAGMPTQLPSAGRRCLDAASTTVFRRGEGRPTAALAWRELALPTHCSRRRLSQRTTGLPRNLTFAVAAEKVRDGDSSHSQVAISDLGKVPAERLHLKTTYSR